MPSGGCRLSGGVSGLDAGAGPQLLRLLSDRGAARLPGSPDGTVLPWRATDGRSDLLGRCGCRGRGLEGQEVGDAEQPQDLSFDGADAAPALVVKQVR